MMRLSGLLQIKKITLVEKHRIFGDVWSFHFTKPTNFRHIAGQHSLFIVPGGGFHPFSIASAPNDNEIAFATHLRSGSKFKAALAQLEPGQNITMWGPIMDFVLQDKDHDVVFLAQGIGITPFRSLLRHAATNRPDLTTTLIHVDSPQHTFRSETEKLSSHSFYPTDPVTFASTTSDTAKSHPLATYYVSGSPRFIKSTTQTLAEAGIKKSSILTDGFLGY